MSEHNQREDDHRQNEICHRIMHQTTPMGPILECVLFSKKYSDTNRKKMGPHL